ncbi:MAG: serine hydroxymethyltransferase [Candidatus Cloacimonadota bacterium]|nr:MAG: serine hydroxymethyltransferase [Candidatus Cloacimonadota bacterium]
MDLIDEEILQVLRDEEDRQRSTIELIASENFTSAGVMVAQGSVLTNKYAEGYPGKRYYGGCEVVDRAESLAIKRVCELFGSEYANVQAHSGSGANMAVYEALLNIGDVVMGMDLSQGGHLTHGSPVNFSGMHYKIHSYGLNDEERIDFDALFKMAREVKPKMIVAGASAYPRIIDWSKFREICDEVGAYLMVDMAHIAGLVAAGVHPSPVGIADVITSTTHKTLRGPRGGFVLTNNEEIIKKVNKIIFPGIQGGPLMHVIAAKATAFLEAQTDEFKEYQKQVIKNADVLLKRLIEHDFRPVTGGTDNHLGLIDLTNKKLSGKKFEKALEKAGITLNKNTVPNETRSPFITSGVRVGTAAVTSRLMKEPEMIQIADWMNEVVCNYKNDEILESIKLKIKEFTRNYPMPWDR